MSKGKRVMCSFISLALASAIMGVIFGVADVLSGKRLTPSSCLWYTLVSFVVGLIGWSVAVPIVLTVKDFRGWRFWGLFATGTAIGPAVILGFALYGAIASHNCSFRYAPEAKNILYVAFVESSLTTLIYLLLVRTPRAAFPRPTA